MEGDDDRRLGVVGRRALGRLLGDLQRLEAVQRPTWPARERVASELGPDAGRLIAALVPVRSGPSRRRPGVFG